jgi:hypothetical protein
VELRGYRFEPLVLALVAVAALSTVNLAGPQDRTRYELTRHVVLHHTLEVEQGLFDRSVFDGRSYSDKAPGMSFLAVPAYQLERLVGLARAPRDWRSEGDLSLWLMRVLTSGILFLGATFVVARAAEGLVRGTGALTAAAFGAASLAAPLAPTFFEHDAAGAFVLGAFVLASRRRFALAGLCAGLAVLFQYAALLAGLAVAVYVARRGARRLGRFALGALPPAGALMAYNAAAFDSPFHLSYRYVANRYAERQHSGFFGIGVPTLGGLRETLFGNLGLLVVSPVTAAAGLGLWLMWRRGHRADAAVAGAAALVFLVVNAGYFLPYGGNSPGPRFLAPALPLLFLGLPFALERFPWPTVALTAVSAVVTTIDSMTWSIRAPEDTDWLPSRAEIAKTVWTWLGLDRNAGAAIVLACALGAVALGAVSFRQRRPA